MTNKLLPPAIKVAAALDPLCDRTIDQEVLVLDTNTVAIVTDVGGVDYILTMMRLPVQRQRPAKQ